MRNPQEMNQVIVHERQRDDGGDVALSMLAGAATGLALGSLFSVFQCLHRNSLQRYPPPTDTHRSHMLVALQLHLCSHVTEMEELNVCDGWALFTYDA